MAEGPTLPRVRQPHPLAVMLAVLLVPLVAFFDYLAGPEFGFSLFYLIPVMLVIVALAATVAALPEEVRSALVGATSLYVLAMVLIGSQVFRHYERISEWLRLRLRTDSQRRAEEERQRELDAMTLE